MVGTGVGIGPADETSDDDDDDGRLEPPLEPAKELALPLPLPLSERCGCVCDLLPAPRAPGRGDAEPERTSGFGELLPLAAADGRGLLAALDELLLVAGRGLMLGELRESKSLPDEARLPGRLPDETLLLVLAPASDRASSGEEECC